MITYSPSLKLVPNAEQIAYMAGSVNNDFILSLYSQYKKYGQLSIKQIEALKKNLAPKPTAHLNRAGVSTMEAVFAKAKSNGLKKPKLIIGRFTFKPATSYSKNPGAIYVTSDNNYLGKIFKGDFSTVAACDANQLSQIAAICESPLEQVKAHGLKYGICSCCGAQLTDPKSIELGIGPVCYKKWFA